MVMRYFGGGIGHLGTGLAPSVEASDEYIPDDTQEEEEDLEFILGADFEKELAEDDEYDQQIRLEGDDRDEDEDEGEDEDDDDNIDDDSLESDDDDGYDDY